MRRWLRHDRVLRLILPLFAVSLVSGAALGVEGGADIVARLGGSEFTATTLKDFVQSLDRNARKQALSDPQLMNRLVGAELARLALLNEAKAKKWEQRPDVARQIDRSRDEIIVSNYLSSVAAIPRDYPSDAEVKVAYDSNRDSFMAPRQYRLAQIFVQLPPTSDKKALDAAQKKANDLARQARAKNANFEAIARTNSEHPASAARGGDLGWADQNQIVPEIRNQVVGMTKDEISDPILGSTGWHIVRMLDTRPAAPRPLAEVKDSLAAMLRQHKAQEAQQMYIARLLEKNPASVNQARLRALFESSP